MSMRPGHLVCRAFFVCDQFDPSSVLDIKETTIEERC